MRKALVLTIAAVCVAGCARSTTPAASPARPGDAVQQKLQELAGSGAQDCGLLKSQAEDQMKTASACAMQAAQSKRPFYVAYYLPGLTVAVAGDSAGKLFLVQSERPADAPPGAPAELKSEPCPSDLRIAQSGRVTCLAPGSFGMSTMGKSPHDGMLMPPAGAENPHGGMSKPPPGTPNPHTGSGTNPPARQP
jgi:hypothetical protein